MIIEHLVADTFGSHIGKYSQRLKVTQKDTTLAEAPLLHLQSVMVISAGVSISSDALQACCEKGIPVFFLDSLGRNYASLYSAGLGATVLTRRRQLQAYENECGPVIAKAVTMGKLHNMAATLKYMAKNRKDTAPEIYEELRLCAGDIMDDTARLEGVTGRGVEEVREVIMGIEGIASQRYWQAVRLLVPEAYGWMSRQHRGATDPMNCLLNYGYGILYSKIEQALVLAGLDPYAGFLHADRPGKPSLVLDFIEEFRQVAVDRVVFGLVNRNFKVEQAGDGKMDLATRKTLAEHILSHLDTNVRYQGKRFALRMIIQMQARQMVAFLRGERATYEPYTGDW